MSLTELGDGQPPHYLQAQPETLHETKIPCSSSKLEHWCKVQQEKFRVGYKILFLKQGNQTHE